MPSEYLSLSAVNKYVLQRLARTIGLKAIVVMYNSPWVRNNPSAHGFVFEWDIHVQVETTNMLKLVDTNGQGVTWPVTKTIDLGDFLKNGITEPRLMVRPPKWNHPEYDGLYVVAEETGANHLIDWNASEARAHSCNVQGLASLLTRLATQDTSVHFTSVRFLIIVPK